MYFNGAYTFIGNGRLNRIDGPATNVNFYDTIVNGNQNRIETTVGNSTCHDFIGNGVVNLIRDVEFSTILNGSGNNVFSNFGTIVGGANGNVTGDFSTILGGNGNSDAGFAYAAVYGQGVTAVAANTFHVECLNAVNTPNITGGPFPTGTLTFINATPGMVAAGFPVGSRIAMIA